MLLKLVTNNNKKEERNCDLVGPVSSRIIDLSLEIINEPPTNKKNEP